MSRPNETTQIVELNIGGTPYTSTVATLTGGYPNSKLAIAVRHYLSKSGEPPNDVIGYTRDLAGRMFVDRDGGSFRFVLDFLRNSGSDESMERILVDSSDRRRARVEAEYFGLNNFLVLLKKMEAKSAFQQSSGGDVVQNKSAVFYPRIYQGPSPITQGDSTGRSLDRVMSTGSLTQNRPFFITIGYRSSYSATRDCSSLEKFRRITRITVSGRSDIAKEIFRDDLNDSRDPDRYPSDGYTSRYYLKHNYLEHAFETLASRGFLLISSCSSGSKSLPSQAKEYKQWTTYCEHVFYRAPWDE